MKTMKSIATALCAVLAAILAGPADAANRYWDTDTGTAPGAGGPTPSGIWDVGTATNWNTNADGSGFPGTWANNNTAVFAAGTDATGTYTATVSGTVALAKGTSLTLEEGNVTLTGGSISGQWKQHHTWNVAAGSTLTIESQLNGYGEGGSATKAGDGTIIIEGTDYRGAQHNINAGTFVVNGTLTAAQPQYGKPLYVNNGGTLGGSGSIIGHSTAVRAGATLAPGASVGTLTFGSHTSLTLDDGAVLEFDLTTTASSDMVSMPGRTLALNSQEWADFTFNTGGGFGTGTYTLIDAGSISGSLGNTVAGNIDGLVGILSASGNDLVLTVSETITATVATLDPVDNATGVSLGANLVMTFEDNVSAGSGNFVIKEDGGSILETISATSSQVTVAGDTVTIDPAVPFDPSTGYYVLIDDGAIFGFGGISDPGNWNFTTEAAPVIAALDPTDNATGVSVLTNLVITFDKDVSKGSGNIVIKEDGGSILETISATSTQVTVSGDTVTIDPSGFLAYETGCHVLIDAGAIAGFGGISDSTRWNFTTEAAPPPLFLYEPFDYGASDIVNVTGLGGDETGFTSSETWTKNSVTTADYLAAGLSIGSGATTLETTGGRFNLSNASAQNVTVTRGIDVGQTGTIYGSYVWRTTSVRGDRRNISWVGISNSGGNQGVTAGDFGAMAHRWGTSKAGVALDSESGNGATAGANWTVGDTYLVLFTVTNLGGTGNQTIKLWMLTSDQFDNHKASDGTLTEAELDIAGTGTASSQVLQRISLTQAAGSDITTDDFLVLGAFQGHTADFDEIRLSNTSFDVVTPVSEPGGPYGNWAGGFGGLTDDDPTLDFDKGGLPTGIEWVLDGDPADGSDDGGIAPTGTPTAGGGLVFVFRRNQDAEDDTNTAISVDYGSNLDGWTAANPPGDGTTMVEEDDYYGTGVDRVTVTIPGSKATNGRLFARLRVDITL